MQPFDKNAQVNETCCVCGHPVDRMSGNQTTLTETLPGNDVRFKYAHNQCPEPKREDKTWVLFLPEPKVLHPSDRKKRR